MLTSGSALLQKTVIDSFWQGAWDSPTPFDGLYAAYESTQETDTRAYLGEPDMPTEWSGGRNFKVLPEHSTTLKNVYWDTSIAIDKKHVRFEQLAEVSGAVRDLGRKAMEHKHKLVSALSVGGSTSTATMDGQNFFDTDHKDPGAVYQTNQDNDLTSAIVSATAPTELEFAAALRGCFNSILSRKDGAGDPIGVRLAPENFRVVVPPTFWSAANRVQTQSQLTGPVGNDMQGKFQLEVDQYSTFTAAFTFYYTGSPKRPFILQSNGGIELNDYIDSVDGNYRYSASWVGQVGYGEWRTAILHTFTT